MRRDDAGDDDDGPAVGGGAGALAFFAAVDDDEPGVDLGGGGPALGTPKKEARVVWRTLGAGQHCAWRGGEVESLTPLALFALPFVPLLWMGDTRLRGQKEDGWMWKCVPSADETRRDGGWWWWERVERK